MNECIASDVTCRQYEFEIRIDAPTERVWTALTEEVNAWWLADFHMVDPNSTVEFDLRPGGRGLVEHHGDGSFLQWYGVQAFLPRQHKIYLVGYLAPDFGGPATSQLCFSLTADGTGCRLCVSDALLGSIDDKTAESLKRGWNQLFDEGLRQFVESGS